MCDACVMNRVADRLGRRGALAAIALAAALPTTASAQQPRVTSFTRTFDLTHTLHPAFPTFGGDPAISVEKIKNFATDGYNMNRLAYAEHVGTHFDAPVHFSAAGTTVDRIPLPQLVGRI